ncbi:hypothetical protein GOODEAATRI_031926, partial [Goodea atripinnis]
VDGPLVILCSSGQRTRMKSPWSRRLATVVEAGSRWSVEVPDILLQQVVLVTFSELPTPPETNSTEQRIL